MQRVDEFYMRRCLQLARCAAGSTSPNPQVGAVIVKLTLKYLLVQFKMYNTMYKD